MAENGQSAPKADRVRAASDGASEKLYHTVTACVRCRQRKTRCDPGLPRCDPCERSKARCEYFDSMKNRTIARNYITSLQANVRRLQAELGSLENDESEEPDLEAMARGAGLIKFSENDESRFLGPSSGIGITRFVMELAKQNTTSKSIKDVVPDRMVRDIRNKADEESEKPTSKIYPLISSVAAPNLPSHDLMERLVDIYMAKAQYLLPLLHEPSFRQDVRTVYHGSTDPTLNFQLRLVIAISMQKLDTQYAGLADSYYLAALPYLEKAIRKMDLSTLQCFALMGQYSVLTPTRTAAFWVVGLAARLCQDLGLCEEKTIAEFPPGNRFNTLETDMRRRLFWIITSMEYGLAHSLGRPSAFGITVDSINVKWFELCDDRYITPGGLLSGHHPIMKKCLTIHFFKMRLIQAEIRRTLYLKKRDAPVNDEDPWFQSVLDRIDDWVRDCPKNDEGSGVSEAWFHGRRCTMIVAMYRPSPQIPQPSLKAAQRCHDASVVVVKLQKHQLESKIVDFTWILTQVMFMAINALLWSLSYPEIREQHPLPEVKALLDSALVALQLTAERWPGVQSALDLYDYLIRACLKSYDTDASFVLSSSAATSPISTQDVGSPRSLAHVHSPASTDPTSLTDPRSPQSNSNSISVMQPNHMSNLTGDGFFARQGSDISVAGMDPGQALSRAASYVSPFQSPQSTSATISSGLASQSFTPQLTHYNIPNFEYQSAQVLPEFSPNYSQWANPMTSAPINPGFYATSAMDIDTRPWLGYFGDEYSRYLQQTYFPTPTQMRSLDLQQQSELMDSLENSELPDISYLVSDSAVLYPAHVQ